MSSVTSGLLRVGTALVLNAGVLVTTSEAISTFSEQALSQARSPPDMPEEAYRQRSRRIYKLQCLARASRVTGCVTAALGFAVLAVHVIKAPHLPNSASLPKQNCLS